MSALPHQPADLSSADTALAGTSDPSAMTAALRPVREARDKQTERAAAAGAIVDDLRRKLDAAEDVYQAESASLQHLDRAIGEHEATIAAARAQRERDRRAREAVERESERERQRQIEDGLAALGREQARIAAQDRTRRA